MNNKGTKLLQKLLWKCGKYITHTCTTSVHSLSFRLAIEINQKQNFNKLGFIFFVGKNSKSPEVGNMYT